MNEAEKKEAQATEHTAGLENKTPQSHVAHSAQQQKLDRLEARRWWIKLFIQPALMLTCGVILVVGLGAAQQYGFISASGGSSLSSAPATGADVQYICPMMCTPPQTEPGRCPVCAMELVQSVSGGGSGGSHSIQVDVAARRVANIQTVAVQSLPINRRIRAIGELSYDEGSLKTLSAYVDGRLDRLYADYTGVVVEKGDHLALVYSPLLYSGQVEFLLARKAQEANRSATLHRVRTTNLDLYESAKERLIELGMTERQIQQLEQDGEANSRLHLCAPISGTVIEKFAVEGQYVKEGQAIYRLADLSTVWLMLELFPEDAAAVRYGQKVEATAQSLPGINLVGRVAFIDPNVDPKTRTVGVRVVIPNKDGLLRVGDFARATIDTPLGSVANQTGVYDPELADKWISPRHPHVVESSAGQCPICGVDLVPATVFGFVSEKEAIDEALVVPRNAVLMAGANSVVYVETEPGRFELRRVVLGPSSGDQIVVVSGVKKGEQVATRGNFLIDSQMQLAGNPSLIDPLKADPAMKIEMTDEIIGALAELSGEDRRQAESQRICPVTKMLLGSMGPPPKVDVNGQAIFICCMGCEGRLLEDPRKYLANLIGSSKANHEEERAVVAALAKLPLEDRAIAERQRVCPVADYRLGAMGTPKKVIVNGTTVFICCEGCRASLLEDPNKYLAKLAAPNASDNSNEASTLDLPPMGVPELLEPESGLPPMEFPQAMLPVEVVR